MSSTLTYARILVLLLVFASAPLFAQLVSTNPIFPNENDLVEVIFDASAGSAGLAGYSGDVYAHTGVITSNSNSPSDWKYVQTNWGQNTSATKLESLGDDKHKLIIGPDVRSYYGVPDNEEILKIAMVFRSDSPVNGSFLEGKTEDFGDIFIDLVEAVLSVSFTLPDVNPLIVEQGASVEVLVNSQLAESVFLYENGELIESSTETISVTIPAQDGTNLLVAEARDENGIAVFDSTTYFMRQANSIAELPEGIEQGINYIDDETVVLCLFAPDKEFVFAIGDFNDWFLGLDHQMINTPDGNYWWLELNDLEAQKEYAYNYLIDGEIRIADPYTEKILDSWNDHEIPESTYPDLKPYPNGVPNGHVSIFQTAIPKYDWEVETFTKPVKESVVIYELLVRDFVAEQNYQTLIDTLSYFEKLGINAIELMPVMEFENNESWGYNPSYMFAPDKIYGPKEQLQKFIDECHKRGIAVILDIVLNHQFGQSPLVKMYWEGNQPAANSPYFNQQATHDFNVGFDMNHDSEAVQYFSKRVMQHWIEEYKIDGFRFDLSKGFTQNQTLGNVGAWSAYDFDRISLWKDYADFIWTMDSEFWVILEHFAAGNEEKELANYGMWLWGNYNYNYSEAAMGYLGNSNFIGIDYQIKSWDEANLVGYMESHDEERMKYRLDNYGASNGNYDTQDFVTALDRLKLAAGLFIPIPGPKMIWQFGEHGYDVSIDEPCRVCPKPILWEYYQDAEREKLFNLYAALNHLKTTEPAFSTNDYELSAFLPFKTLHLNHDDMDVVVAGNFELEGINASPSFLDTGWWYDYFTGDSLFVEDVNLDMYFEAGQLKLWTTKKLPLPPGPIWDTPTSINYQETEKDMFNIYPSITSGEKVVIEFFLTKPIKQAFLEVVNIHGFVLWISKLQELNGYHRIDWTPPPAFNGEFFVRLRNQHGSSSKKLIIAR